MKKRLTKRQRPTRPARPTRPTKRRRTTKRAQERKEPDINTVYPENALTVFKKYVPFFNNLTAQKPELINAVRYYKFNGYQAINNLMNKKSVSLYLNGKGPAEDRKEDLQAFVPKGALAKQFKKYYGAFNKNLSDIDLYAKTTVTKTLMQIEYLMDVFNLFSQEHKTTLKIPMLYRGITGTVNDELLGGKKVGDTITMKAFQSCSSSVATAMQFTSCGSRGPCCLFRLRVDPRVRALPLFWMQINNKISESYIYSEHEYLLEPFCEFKITKIGDEQFPVNKALKCDYDYLNADGTLTLTVYNFDVLPPAPEAFTDFVKDLKKKLPSLDKHYGSSEFILGIN